MEIVSIFHLLITKYRSNDLGSLTIVLFRLCQSGFLQNMQILTQNSSLTIKQHQTALTHYTLTSVCIFSIPFRADKDNLSFYFWRSFPLPL